MKKQKIKTKSDRPAPTPPLDRAWPYSLTYQQKLHQLGYLLAAIFTDVHTPDILKTTLHQAVSGLREKLERKDATTIAMAWAMGQAVEDDRYDEDE
jgi:hypothetical protein